jgi:para-aminobenzoate synthetase component 1
MPEFLDKNSTIKIMNKLGRENCPFFFLISYDQNKNLVETLDDINPDEIKFKIETDKEVISNFAYQNLNGRFEILPKETDFETYHKAFSFVKNEIHVGNSFLVNLTLSTPIIINKEPEEIVKSLKSRYVLWLKDEFLCFSPESFVEVDEAGKISSFPMKGTINANLENAREIILNDQKEFFEHTTIVDLIRNDLSKVSEKVWVERFRFLDEITKENGQKLLQVSSEVCGNLPKNWKENIGEWFMQLLPAGSITGAPKDKTCEIIVKAEKALQKNGKRGHYTGVFGIFDGNRLTSAVAIRFIEQHPNGLYYKSGGGITARSEAEKEFEEVKQKIYVPVF